MGIVKLLVIFGRQVGEIFLNQKPPQKVSEILFVAGNADSAILFAVILLYQPFEKRLGRQNGIVENKSFNPGFRDPRTKPSFFLQSPLQCFRNLGDITFPHVTGLRPKPIADCGSEIHGEFVQNLAMIEKLNIKNATKIIHDRRTPKSKFIPVDRGNSRGGRIVCQYKKEID
jgi:hypothetical protein